MGANLWTTQNPSDLNSNNKPSAKVSPSPSTMSSPSTSESQNPDQKTLDFQNPDQKTLDNQNPDSKNPSNQNPDPKNPNDQNPEISNQSNYQEKENGGEEEEEEVGECGFCLFMKGGGCKDEFIAWENCVEEAEKNKEDIVEKCFQVTSNLKKCMEAHSDYYEPILRAEKAAEEELNQELESEREKKNDEQNVGSKGVEERTVIEVEKEG